MEYVKCNLCGFDDAKFILRARSRVTNEGKEFFKLANAGGAALSTSILARRKKTLKNITLPGITLAPIKRIR